MAGCGAGRLRQRYGVASEPVRQKWPMADGKSPTIEGRECTKVTIIPLISLRILGQAARRGTDGKRSYESGLARSRSLGPRGPSPSVEFLSPLPTRLKSRNLTNFHR